MYRFAPSPTGDMHIGNLRAALINYLCSLQDKSGFILRIEDTDTARNIAGKDEEIKELLKLFGVNWQHFYVQSKNLKYHRQMALKLVSEKKAFACFCTTEELEAKKEKAKAEGKPYRYDGTCEKLSDSEVLDNEKPFVIRLKKPSKAMEFTDLIKGKLHFEPENIDSFVIMRADKTPTYNFACAVDDMMEGVTCIIRGEDHTSNTPKQEHIRASLGYDKPMLYAHLPIILNEDGQKMSKREAHSSVKWLLELGILPVSIANYLLLLGNKTPQELFTLKEAVEFFDLKKISKAPARFDLKKLLQINREHIKRLDDESLAGLLGFDELDLSLNLKADFAKLAKFYTQEASTINELKEKLQGIFKPNTHLVEYKEYEEQIKLLKEILTQLELSNLDYEGFKNELLTKSKLKGKAFFAPLRLLLTSSLHGPDLSELYPLLKPLMKEILGEKHG
ncbi:glutamate--tRNA ligase [Campylobacter sp. MIT 12-5580]|uniref:glutamate--tRNA ligase n=1 Tax=Campylobacter sp. MIT 12-5580 TaxID=2040651 RepID=UPI0010F6ECA3|nr:glutamate--tRNA ligase [Campylobacter sp. MIT 12-5580]TKX29068.1 glutamate--tRNA ligase [Campylobacter sp. MIT 12-5580]